MRPGLEDTLAAGTAASDPAATATAPRTPVAAAPGLVSGQQLGHFRIDRPLGAGGMGEVYLATDLALDRPVAIKVLPSAVAREPARRERLIREARAQARITHPNVGHIYFIGEEAGGLYFAMEYVSGDTLAARVAKGPLAVDDALAVIRSAALGLREAQRNGITHRDIKPSNLMIDGHGMVKVLDFGLAASAPDPTDAPAPGTPIAQTSLAGTPLYMAPEQARGEPIDFHADIYALGATLFHLVSGRPPFEADTLDGLLTKHASAERPALPRRSGQPRTTIAAIDALCSRMMAPRPADRFASYDDLIRAIELASVEHMRPAGLWVRTMATMVDLTIGMLLTLVLVVPIKYLITGNVGQLGPYGLIAYVLYAIILISRTGRTSGQWLFELEVVDVATGHKPSPGRATVRVLVPIGVPLIGSLLGYVLEGSGYEMGDVLEFIFLLTALCAPLGLLWASLRSLGKHTFWDKLSRTMVRYRTRRTTAI